MKPITISTQMTGKVTGVSFDKGETVLHLADRKVFLRDVESFAVEGHSVKQNIPSVATGQDQLNSILRGHQSKNDDKNFDYGEVE